MTTPVERAAAHLQQAMRELIPEDLARLKAEHDSTHAGGGFLMPDRLNSPVPPNLTGVIQDESVETDLAGYPALTNQQLTNVHLLNALAAIGVAAFDPDTILTDDYEVLVDDDGNVLVDG